MIPSSNGFCVVVSVVDGQDKFGKCIVALRERSKKASSYQTVYLNDMHLMRLKKGAYLAFFDYQVMLPILSLFRFKWLFKLAFKLALKRNGVVVRYEKVNAHDVVNYLFKKYYGWASWDNTKSWSGLETEEN